MTKRRILAVDDEPLITRIVQVNLERVGYEVASAPNGIEALATLRGGEPLPDLILLDVNMPYMDGFETLREIKADANLKDIPIIIMTARSRNTDILHVQQYGVPHYIIKPINPEALITLVNDVLGNTTEASSLEGDEE